MVAENLAAILNDTNDLRLEPFPIPQISDDEVLLRMDTVGICGSDVHYWTTGRCGTYVVKEPMVMGHEASGVVDKIGAKVKNLKPGDRVAIEPGVPCRYCEFCKTGRYHLCPEIQFCATPPVRGNLCTYYKHAADFCYKLPDHVTMEEGALLEPLAVGVHSLRIADVQAGDTVLVLGAGPIGQVTMQAARAMGANVLITDSREFQLGHAKKNGADYVLLLQRDEHEAEQVKKIHQVLDKAPDVSIYCSGGPNALKVSMQAIKNGGKSILVGFPSSEVPLPLAEAVSREITVMGSFRYANEYPIALDLVEKGKVNLKPLVTHHYSFDQTLEAYEMARRGVGIKIMIHVQPRDQNNPKKFDC